MGAWPRSDYLQVQTLTLPSGPKVRARRPSLISILADTSELPTAVTLSVWRMLSGHIPDIENNPGDVQHVARLINTCCKPTLVEPRVVEKGETDVTVGEDGFTTGTVVLDDLPDEDRMHLFLFSRGMVQSEEEKARGEATPAALKTFSGGTGGTDAGPSSEEVRTETVVAAGNPV